MRLLSPSNHEWIELPRLLLIGLVLLLWWCHLSELVHIDSHVHPCKHVCLSALRDTLLTPRHHESWRTHLGSLLSLSKGVYEPTTWLLGGLLMEGLLLVESIQG
jgi:hypothetical protein